MISCDLIVRLLSASKREGEGTWRARLRGLQKAWVNCTGSRALATRRDCFRPISFNTVSTLDTIRIPGLPICPCMMPCRCYQSCRGCWGYVLFCFAMTDDHDLPPLSITY